MKLRLLLLQISVGMFAWSTQAQEAPASRLPEECIADFQKFCGGVWSSLPQCILLAESSQKLSLPCLRALTFAWPELHIAPNLQQTPKPSAGGDQPAKPSD